MSEELVQLLIVADGELQMTRDDTGLLVVTSGVASQLKNLSSEVLQDSSQVDGGTFLTRQYETPKIKRVKYRQHTSTNTLGVVSLAEKTVNTSDGERETGLRRTAVQRTN